MRCAVANVVISSGDEEMGSPGSRKWLKHIGEGSSKERRVLGLLHEVAEGSSDVGEGTQPPRLNPSAKEWNPTIERASEEDRCLFLTFSNGYPLTETQIIAFFNNKYGPCVEKVYVHWEDPRNINVPPLFGKVVFKVSCIPAIVLSGHKQTKFMVDGKPLWCKKFEAKKKQSHGSKWN